MSADVSWRDLLARPEDGDHIAQAYRDETFLTEAASHFVASGLVRGDGVVVIATPSHWKGIAGRLAAEGAVLRHAELCGQLIVLDAEKTLSACLVNGIPDWKAFQDAVGSVINFSRRRYRKTRVFGEMADIPWQGGDREAAMRLEELWNHLVKVQDLSLCCAYRVDPLDAEAYEGGLQGVCQAHSHLVPAGDYDELEHWLIRASEEVLGARFAKLLHTLAAAHPQQTEMPPAHSTLLWLRQHMPSIAGKVLARARAYHTRAASPAR